MSGEGQRECESGESNFRGKGRTPITFSLASRDVRADGEANVEEGAGAGTTLRVLLLSEYIGNLLLWLSLLPGSLSFEFESVFELDLTSVIKRNPGRQRGQILNQYKGALTHG